MTFAIRCLTILAVPLAVLTCAVTANAAAPAGRQEECEEDSIVARAYTATEAGLKIEVRDSNRLFVNGRMVAHDPSGMAWKDSTNAAFIARAGNNIIVVTDSDDCVDVDEQHYFILTTSGRLRLFGPDRGANGDNGFIQRGRDLIYWDVFFCYDSDPEDKNRMSHIEVLKPGARKFVRVDRPFQELCSRPARLKRNADSLEFRPMKAVEASRPGRRKGD